MVHVHRQKVMDLYRKKEHETFASDFHLFQFHFVVSFSFFTNFRSKMKIQNLFPSSEHLRFRILQNELSVEEEAESYGNIILF